MFIEMFPARSGDSFLIRLDNGKNILIDMGYADTYKEYIRNRLIEIKNDKQCIDLLIITHIDEDHIAGAIEFLKENGSANNANIIEVKEIWHNSYRHLQFQKGKVNKISEFERRRLEDIKLKKGNSYQTNELHDISAKQGSTLAGFLYGLGYASCQWNRSFNYEAVNIDIKNEVELDDIKLYILSPDSKKLNNLSKQWFNELLKIDIQFSISAEEIFDDAYEMYIKNLKPILDTQENKNISYCTKQQLDFNILINKEIKQIAKDESKSNGGSISFILEHKDKKMLFLADSHEDIVLANLEKYEKSGKSLEFDIVKVSHHGSLKNNFNWIEKVKSKRYLFSTNGEKHGHPDAQVLAKILQCDRDEKTFYFNYPLNIAKEIDQKILKEKYAFSVEVANKGVLKIEVGAK